MGQTQSTTSLYTPIPEIETARLGLNAGNYTEATTILTLLLEKLSPVELVKTAAAHRILCFRSIDPIPQLSQTLAMYERLLEPRPECEVLQTLVRICQDDLAEAKEVERKRNGERRYKLGG